MSAAGNPSYICFYSNKCKFCEYFLKELAKMPPLKPRFTFVCVDPSPNRPAIPKMITQVPAVIIKGDPNVLLGNDAINWLATMKLQSTPPSGPAGMKPPNPQGIPEEPEAYFATEMGGRYSSAYTYIDKEFQELGGTIGNFDYLGGGGASMSTTMSNHIQGANMAGDRGGGGGGKSAKEKAFESQMTEYMARRDVGMPQQIKRM